MSKLGGSLPVQVVVDPVVPDEVVGSHPREHLRQRARRMDALLARAIARDADQLLRVQRADRRFGVEVEQHDAERRRIDALVADGRHVAQHQRGHDAAGAEAGDVHLLAAADAAHRVDRLEDRLDVVVDAPVALLLLRVAPAHGEHLEALARPRTR